MPVATLLLLGSVGDDVRELQSLLASQNFDPGPVDGIFGPQTDEAVRAFQGATGLEVDGIVGPATWDALRGGGPEPTSSLLVRLGLIAERQFGLRVTECNAPGAPAHWGPVTPGIHSATSHHHKGEAFDASGPIPQIHAFTRWVDEHHASEMAELIQNPTGSIDNGQRVPPDFWGSDTWHGHRHHCHAAVAA